MSYTCGLGRPGIDFIKPVDGNPVFHQIGLLVVYCLQLMYSLPPNRCENHIFQQISSFPSYDTDNLLFKFTSILCSCYFSHLDETFSSMCLVEHVQ